MRPRQLSLLSASPVPWPNLARALRSSPSSLRRDARRLLCGAALACVQTDKFPARSRAPYAGRKLERQAAFAIARPEYAQACRPSLPSDGHSVCCLLGRFAKATSCKATGGQPFLDFGLSNFIPCFGRVSDFARFGPRRLPGAALVSAPPIAGKQSPAGQTHAKLGLYALSRCSKTVADFFTGEMSGGLEIPSTYWPIAVAACW
jgi:hypothetical protein